MEGAFYQKVKRILGIRLYSIAWQDYFIIALRRKQSFSPLEDEKMMERRLKSLHHAIRS